MFQHLLSAEEVDERENVKNAEIMTGFLKLRQEEHSNK
jgi:hypothetical protein